MTTDDFTTPPDLASRALGGDVQIVPSVFDPAVAPAVAAAVREGAGKGGESDV